ncbi:MAG: hypothetical protein ACREDH_09890 [Methylocella sp.]
MAGMDARRAADAMKRRRIKSGKAGAKPALGLWRKCRRRAGLRRVTSSRWTGHKTLPGAPQEIAANPNPAQGGKRAGSTCY